MLSVAMAVYNDYDGVVFTVQDIRLRFPEVSEIVVVDNHPESGGQVKKFCQDAAVRYVPYEKRGSAPAKQKAIESCRNDWVLLIDSHVLLKDIAGVLGIIKDPEQKRNLHHGQLLLNDLGGGYMEMLPVWRTLMWGIWGKNMPTHTENGPIEVWGHGMGMALLNQEYWPNFHPDMEGFGGEEGYIHEKYRGHGGKVLSHPDIKWWHRFHNQSAQTKFPNLLHERLRNYYVGFKDLGRDDLWQEAKDHFQDHCSDHNYAAIRAALQREGLTI